MLGACAEARRHTGPGRVRIPLFLFPLLSRLYQRLPLMRKIRNSSFLSVSLYSSVLHLSPDPARHRIEHRRRQPPRVRVLLAHVVRAEEGHAAQIDLRAVRERGTRTGDHRPRSLRAPPAPTATPGPRGRARRADSPARRSRGRGKSGRWRTRAAWACCPAGRSAPPPRSRRRPARGRPPARRRRLIREARPMQRGEEEVARRSPVKIRPVRFPRAPPARGPRREAAPAARRIREPAVPSIAGPGNGEADEPPPPPARPRGAGRRGRRRSRPRTFCRRRSWNWGRVVLSSEEPAGGSGRPSTCRRSSRPRTRPSRRPSPPRRRPCRHLRGARSFAFSAA